MSAHRDSFEARLAFRTRLLDHIAGGTPSRRDAGRRPGRARRGAGHGPGRRRRATWTAGPPRSRSLLDDDRAYAAARRRGPGGAGRAVLEARRERTRGLVERVASSPRADDAPPACRLLRAAPRRWRARRSSAAACARPSHAAGRAQSRAADGRLGWTAMVSGRAARSRSAGGGYDLKDHVVLRDGPRRTTSRRSRTDPEASILEIGCSNGATGALALAEGKCSRYCGVELFPEPAAAARERLTEVVEGDVEQVELPWAEHIVRRADPERGARAPARPLGRARAPAAAAPARARVFREHAQRGPPRRSS